MLTQKAPKKISAKLIFAKVFPLFDRICLTTKPSEIIVVMMAMVRVNTTTIIRLGAFVKMYTTSGSSDAIKELEMFSIVKQKQSISIKIIVEVVIALYIFSFLFCKPENSNTIGKTPNRFRPIYKGKDINLKILELFMIASSRVSAVLTPTTPNTIIDINKNGIKMMLVVVSPFSPQITIIKIRTSDK